MIFRKTFIDEKTGLIKKAGDMYKLPKLAETMKVIAKEGGNAFYKGSLTSQLLEDLNKINSIITKEDLANYKLVYFDFFIIVTIKFVFIKKLNVFTTT